MRRAERKRKRLLRQQARADSRAPDRRLKVTVIVRSEAVNGQGGKSLSLSDSFGQHSLNCGDDICRTDRADQQQRADAVAVASQFRRHEETTLMSGRRVRANSAREIPLGSLAFGKSAHVIRIFAIAATSSG